jgi:predicted ester cyclase
MSMEENKALIYRLYDLYSRHELDACNELYSPDWVFHSSSRDMTLEENKQFDIMVVKAFPDGKLTILDMIAEGDKVAYIVNATGTHTGGPFMGIQPTGKKMNMTNTYIVRIADNKIMEHRGTTEFLAVLEQLGVVHRQ